MPERKNIGDRLQTTSHHGFISFNRLSSFSTRRLFPYPLSNNFRFSFSPSSSPASGSTFRGHSCQNMRRWSLTVTTDPTECELPTPFPFFLSCLVADFFTSGFEDGFHHLRTEGVLARPNSFFSISSRQHFRGSACNENLISISKTKGLNSYPIHPTHIWKVCHPLETFLKTTFEREVV